MSTAAVMRPVVRSFTIRFAKDAAAYVRKGGQAIVWDSEKRARLFFSAPDGDPADLGAWAAYDLGRHRWQVHARGTFSGLASVRVPADCLWIVTRRAERDSVHAGPRRRVAFDCTKCGACCRENEVVLGARDVARFKRAGRDELAKRPYARRRNDGRLVLTLLRNKRCRHLGRNLTCGIYEIRPHACSEFPMGSESCLFAREDELGKIDGAS